MKNKSKIYKSGLLLNKQILILILSIIFTVACAACLTDNPTFTNTDYKITVEVDESKTADEVINALDGHSVTWASADILTAQVDQNGKITGIKVGKTTVIVKFADGTLFCEFAVEVVKNAAQLLAEAKAEALLQLDEILSDLTEADYEPSDWQNIIDYYDNAQDEINEATTVLGVSDLLTQAENDINSVKTIAQNLLDAKAAAKLYLNNLVDELQQEDYDGDDWDAILQYLQDAIDEIDQAEAIADVSNAKANAEGDITSVLKASEKGLSSSDIQDALYQLNIYTYGWEDDATAIVAKWIDTGNTSWAVIEPKLQTALQDITNATTLAELNQAKNAFYNDAGVILRKAKQSAKEEVLQYFGQLSEDISPDNSYLYTLEVICNNAVMADSDIEVATTTALINSALNGYKNSLNTAFKTVFAAETAMQISAYRDTFLQSEYFSEEWNELDNIVSEAFSRLNAKANIDEITQLKSTIIAELDAVKNKVHALSILYAGLDSSQNIVVDAYAILKGLAQTPTLVSEFEQTMSIERLLEILTDSTNIQELAEFRTMQIISKVFSSRLALASPMDEIEDLFSDSNFILVQNLLGNVKSDILGLDAHKLSKTNALNYIKEFEDTRAGNYTKDLYNIDWIDDYFVEVEIFYSAQESDGVIVGTPDESFTLRLRDEQGSGRFVYNSAYDDNYAALIAIADPERSNHHFDGWKQARYWHYYTESTGQTITYEAWIPYNDVRWGVEPPATRTNISLTHFPTFVKTFVELPSNNKVQIFAAWTALNSQVELEDYFGKWSYSNSISTFELIINSDGTAVRQMPTADSPFILGNYTYELNPDKTLRLLDVSSGDLHFTASLDIDGNILLTQISNSMITTYTKVV